MVDIVSYWAAKTDECPIALRLAAQLGTCSRHLADIDAIRRRRRATWGRRSTEYLARITCGEDLDADVVEACIASGADIHSLRYPTGYNERMYSLLEYAIAYCKFDAAEMTMNAPDGMRPTTWAICLALPVADLEFIIKLLDAAVLAHLDLQEIMGMACVWNNGGAVGDLLRRFPAVREVFPTALHSAVQQGNWEIAEMLLEAGADPNGLSNGRTPLVLAADLPMRMTPMWHRVVVLLLRYGADVNVTAPFSKRTLLHKAAKIRDPQHVNQHVFRITTLLEAGANPNLRDSRRQRPVDLARDRMNYYPNMHTCYVPLVTALSQSHVSNVK